MARLVLVDTSDALPGLLPLHAWSALMATELVLVADAEHPFVPHLETAGLRWEAVPANPEGVSLAGTDLLAGGDPERTARADWVVRRAQEAGEAVYLFGPADDRDATRTLGMQAANAGVEVEVVYFAVTPKGTRLLELVAVEARLRGPEGCPWDREQTHASLMRYGVEEMHELADAVAAGDHEAIHEELGDVLLQVVFHAQIAEDEGRYDVDDVAGSIAEKLVRRHPHVFGDESAGDAGSVMSRWEELKAAEKAERTGPFDGVAAGQPALPLAEKLQQRAAKLGLDWPVGEDAVARLRREVDALAAAEPGSPAFADRFGEVLAALAAVARRHGLDPEQALRRSAHRFRQRVERALDEAGADPEELSAADWQRLWAATEGEPGEGGG
jgi:XTP/dITP diphosphohydrolase